jgi:hypothetical protein
MGKAYNSQDFLAIKCEYTSNIQNLIASAVIKYVDPDETEGEWPAIHDPINRLIIYDLPNGTTLADGKWKAWSYATMTDGRVIPGEPDFFTIHTEGT